MLSIAVARCLARACELARQFAMELGFGDLLDEVFGSDPEGATGQLGLWITPGWTLEP